MKKNVLLFSWLLLVSFISNAQDPAQYGTPFAGVPAPQDVNMYQVHVRPYSAAGNLQGVIARLDAIKNLGTNVIYLMPIYPVGQDSRSSISPYCIKDFKSVGSEYGTLTDLRSLVDGAHSRGMAVMLDWVANQTSWDHPWITQHPDWYVRDGNGVIQPLNPFPDVAALNFNNTAMRAAMVDAMRYWIFAANIDGYRCDFANNPPLDFWTNTINNLRGITSHKLLMFAEGDRLENFQTGFDMNFGDKWYYDAIKPIRNGTSVSQIQTTTNTEYTYATSGQQVVRYTANHDTETSETAIQVFGGHAGVVVNYLVSAYMRGVPFLTSGQEVDFNQTIPWPYTSVKINWSANTGAAADFTRVNNFRTSSTAIRRGTMTNYSDNNVCAFTKINGTEKVVVLANMRNGTYNYTIPSALAGSYKDAYSGAAVTLTSGASQSLAAFQYRVLTTAGAGCTSTAITPYVQVNGGAWQQTATASLAAGGTVTMGPQPNTGGSWSWSGPGGFTATTREIIRSNIQTSQAGNYVATYTNTSGCNSTQTFTITVTGGSTTYYTILNRWQANTYLYDGGNGQVKYGTNPGTNTLYQWAREDAGSGYVLLKNRSTGKLMHVENQNGSVQCDAANATWYSAMWTIADAGSGWNYIQNRWQPSEWIHLENLLGYAQYSGAQTGWYSAMWQFTAVATSTSSMVQSQPLLEVVPDNTATLEVSPNPATGGRFSIRVTVPGSSLNTLTIFDMRGQAVTIKKLVSNATLSYQLPAGLYLIELTGKQTRISKKLVVQ